MSEEQESQQTEQEIRHELIKRNLKAKLKIDYYRKKQKRLLNQKEGVKDDKLNESEDINDSDIIDPIKRPAEADIIRSIQKGVRSSLPGKK